MKFFSNMSKKKIEIMKAGPGQFAVNVVSRTNADDISQSLSELRDADIATITFTMPAASASDFMLVQLLALLKKEGKHILCCWTDHEPSAPIQTIFESLIH